MWLLLLVATAAGEWVEISQHHRRAQPPRRAPPPHQGDEPNKIYANYSLTERSWHRNGLPRITNVGSVRRVQLQDKDKLTFSIGALSDSSRAKTTAIDREYGNIGSVKAPNMKKENVEADKVKRKPNIDRFGTGNVTGVSIHNPLMIEKTKPEVYIASNHISKKNKYQEILINDDEDNNDESETSYESIEVNPGIKNKSSIKVKQYSEGNELNVERKFGDKSRNSNETYKTTNNEDRSSPAHSLHPSTPFIEHTTVDYFDKNIEIKIKTPTELPKSQQKIKEKTGNDDYPDPNTAERKHVNSDGSTKSNTVQVIWKLMKVVADNISRNTRRSFRSKVRYLEDLQNNIVANIAEQIELTWPDDVAAGAQAGGARRRRDAQARGHVEFPSSESALMTISFLTFAVFLIKLVLQVIHTYKNKTMMVTPALVAAVGRAAAAASLPKQIHP